jgi:hypothetical protein
MNGDHLDAMHLTSKIDKLRCLNLQKGKEVGSVIVFHGAPHSSPRTQLPINCHKFHDDPILLSLPYVVQSDALPDAFSHSMQILDFSEPQFSLQITDDLMLLAREFGHNELCSATRCAQ